MKLYPSFHSPEVNPSYPDLQQICNADFSIFAFVMAFIRVLLFSIISSGSDVWVNNAGAIALKFYLNLNLQFVKLPQQTKNIETHHCGKGRSHAPSSSEPSSHGQKR